MMVTKARCMPRDEEKRNLRMITLIVIVELRDQCTP